MGVVGDLGFEDGPDDVRCVGGEDGEVGFALVAFGFGRVGVGLVFDSDEGGLAYSVFSPWLPTRLRVAVLRVFPESTPTPLKPRIPYQAGWFAC